MLDTVYNTFDFRVLRENRRVTVDAERASESEAFHAVLSDVALGDTTDRVKDFVVAAYVRGARVGCAEKTDFEGSTSVFTKRRYRDRWNRTLVRRIAKTRNHTLKVKGRVRSRGARGNGWFNERRTLLVRRNSRTQSLFIFAHGRRLASTARDGDPCTKTAHDADDAGEQPGSPRKVRKWDTGPLNVLAPRNVHKREDAVF